MALQKIPGRAIQLDSQANSDVMYFDGTDWVRLEKGDAEDVLTVNEDSTAPQWGPVCVFHGTQFGYACGGLELGSPHINHNEIQKYSFATDANSTNTGDLTRSERFINGHSSSTHGYCSGGIATVTSNTIDRFSFTTEGNATDWADLNTALDRCASVSSCTHGFTMGGEQGSTYYDVIEKFPFATQTNATDWADISEITYAGAGCSSTTHGYMMGGTGAAPASVLSNRIEKFPYATQTNSTDVGDITLARHTPGGASSITHGYCAGGCVQSTTLANSDIVERVSFATDGNSTDHGDLSLARRHMAGSSSDTHGYMAGGNNGTVPGSSDVMSDRIDKWAYANNTTATDVANLKAPPRDGLSGHQY